jgi:transcription antitermination factor NusG
MRYNAMFHGQERATQSVPVPAVPVAKEQWNGTRNGTQEQVTMTARNAHATRDAERRAEQRRRDEERIRRVDGLLTQYDGDWHVVLVPPQKELLVERLLVSLGFPAFVPIQFRWRRVNSHQKVRRHVPYVMASRYVFIGRQKGGKPFPWSKLLALDLINRTLTYRDAQGEVWPVGIPRGIMRDLFATSQEANDRLSKVRLNKSVAAGDAVQLIRGPFAGHVVDIQGIERGRAQVIVQLFGKANEIEVELGDLEAA